jgi:cytoplasmic tRNA 2-thiolation protein 2
MFYVNTKAVKRMETYRARGSTSKTSKKLLLPISFGPSSASLLYILDNHLQGQIDRIGRTSYELILVYVELQIDQTTNSNINLERLKSRFPRHVCIATNVKEALKLGGIDWNAMGLHSSMSADGVISDGERFVQLLSSVTSATSRADLASILLTRLLVDVAQRNGCESILFGDSTTRLAEKTLTETAKGRGFSLPWQVSDGMSPYGVNFHYPMRDLLKKEIVKFSSLTSPPLTDIIVYQSQATQVSASSKSTTIDDLMAQYFESVEENYPSIVANVVRTSSKLKAPEVYSSSTACGLCGLPVVEGTDGIHGWGGDQSLDIKSSVEERKEFGILCYGCSRSING